MEIKTKKIFAEWQEDKPEKYEHRVKITAETNYSNSKYI